MSEAAFEPSLLARATRRQILVRMLLNLKKLYVKMHSFPQARATTDALLALQPSSLADLRDRGLLAYHMNDFSHALRDLEELPEAGAAVRAGRGSEERDRTGLGARQDAAPPRRPAELGHRFGTE